MSNNKMDFKKYLKLNIFLLASLSGCNHYYVETDFNEFRNSKSCSLYRHLLRFEFIPFKGGRRTEINLGKLENEKDILLSLQMESWARYSSFKPDSRFVFSIYNNEMNVEIIKLEALGAESISYVQRGQGGTYGNVNFVFTKISPEQFLKIANAEKVTFSFETSQEAIEGELSKNDLQPFREYVQKCLIKK